jgi:hypothetical protein
MRDLISFVVFGLLCLLLSFVLLFKSDSELARESYEDRI